MHAFVAGGSGQTGGHVIDILIDRGHTVTALVRNRNNVRRRPGLSIQQGTPARKEDLERCFSKEKPNAVFVNLASKDSSNNAFLTGVVKNLVAVMKEYKVPKIVYMSAFGVGNSFPAMNWLMKIYVRNSNLSNEFKDHEGAEQILRDAAFQGIQWISVRPVMLRDGPAREVIELGDGGEKRDSFMPGITRASVAAFMVKAEEQETWYSKTPVIRN